MLRTVMFLAVVCGLAGTSAAVAAQAPAGGGIGDPPCVSGDGSPARPPALSDEQYRQLAIGTWEDDYQGKRTMTLAEDGTGQMVVELQGLKARLFAARLEFRMQWRIEKGRLHKRTLGGEPAARVQMILKTMGDRVDEPILELTDRRLLLLDQNGETRYDWRRVPPPEEDAQ